VETTSGLVSLAKSFARLIVEINTFVDAEKGRGFLKILFTREDRIAAIEVYHRRICATVNAFQVSLRKLRNNVGLSLSKVSALIDVQEWQNRNTESRAEDQRLLSERLTELELNHVELRETLGVSDSLSPLLLLRVSEQICITTACSL
jgi:hypothetical protein